MRRPDFGIGQDIILTPFLYLIVNAPPRIKGHTIHLFAMREANEGLLRRIVRKLFPKSLAFVLLLQFGLFASAYDFEIDGFYYNVLSETGFTVEITSGDEKYSGDVVIPSTVSHDSKTYAVKSIGKSAFSNCDLLISVNIPISVSVIDAHAFFKCTNLNSIIIPESVTEIGAQAFSNCSTLESIDVSENNPNFTSADGILYKKDMKGLLQCPAGKYGNVIIPTSVTGIMAGAFYGCSHLTSITIPNSVRAIGLDLFRDCSSLTSITLPASIRSIAHSAFKGCSKMESIEVDNNSPYLSSVDGILYDKKVSQLYVCPAGKKGDVTIPETVTSINESAFENCENMTSVKISNSVTSINPYAFSGCTLLTSITIPESVTTIANSVFSYCSGLASVILPETITTIGSSSFWCCSRLKSIKIPESVISIDRSAFYGCERLTSMTIPSAVASIGEDAFRFCSSLESFIVAENNQNFTAKDDILYTKDFNTLLKCPETKRGELKIDELTKSISKNAFERCLGLKSVTIPKSVSSIGNNAFFDCKILSSVYCEWEDPVECEEQSFDVIIKHDAILYVPKGTIEKYKAVTPWKDFVNIEEMGKSSINEINSSDDIKITTYRGIISVNGLDDNETVLVYNIAGQNVYTGANGIIKNLPSGLYIVKAGIKIVKVVI